MANLQVQNTFDPYYSGRNASETTRWIIRRKDETAAAAEKGDATTTPAGEPDSKKN